MCQDSTHRHIFIGRLHIREKLQKYTMNALPPPRQVALWSPRGDGCTRQLLSPTENTHKVSTETKTPFKNMHQTMQSQRKRKHEPELHSVFIQFNPVYCVYRKKKPNPTIYFIHVNAKSVPVYSAATAASC